MKKYITILSAALLLVSCIEKTPVREPSPIADENLNSAFFDSGNVSEFTIDPASGAPLEIVVSLENVPENNVTVPIVLKNDGGGIFSLNENTVTFPAGQKTANVKLSYDASSVQKFVSYSFTLELDPASYNPYKALDGSAIFTGFVLFEKWNFIGNGVFSTDLSPLYGWKGNTNLEMYQFDGEQIYELRGWPFKALYAAMGEPDPIATMKEMGVPERIRFTVTKNGDEYNITYDPMKIDNYDDVNPIVACLPSAIGAPADYDAFSQVFVEDDKYYVDFYTYLGVIALGGGWGFTDLIFSLEEGKAMPLE